jgi:3'(2'), 5'-bisphosphate nucleotidase
VIDNLLLATESAMEAGVEILNFYGDEIEVKSKIDGSPLTHADCASHDLLTEALSSTGIPIVSEEGESLLIEEDTYWLIDPLDGTKDFLAQNNEFTINIALVERGKPVMGVIHAPALGETYAGGIDHSPWFEKNGNRSLLKSIPKSKNCRMAVSRFHDHPDVGFFAEINHIDKRIEVGSALKYGLLARGEVDVVPRLVGSSEWDVAAGQAIVESAGGRVIDWHSAQPLSYGKPGRRNPRLISFRAPYDLSEFKLMNYEPELL